MRLELVSLKCGLGPRRIRLLFKRFRSTRRESTGRRSRQTLTESSRGIYVVCRQTYRLINWATKGMATVLASHSPKYLGAKKCMPGNKLQCLFNAQKLSDLLEERTYEIGL